MTTVPTTAGNSIFLAFGRSIVGAVLLILALPLSGCIAVGYSSSGGWFLWPGGLGLVFVVLLILFLMRRR